MSEQKPKVLLIEDEQDAIVLYRTQFEAEGFELETAGNTSDGLAKVKAFQPQVILLDVMLPGESGLDLLDKLKKDTDLKDIPVITLTNLAEEVGFEQAIKRGAYGYIVKAERTPKQVAQLVRQVIAEIQNKNIGS